MLEPRQPLTAHPSQAWAVKQEGESAKLAAINELPEKVDHDRHAALVEKLRLDPGKLAAKAAERGMASL